MPYNAKWNKQIYIGGYEMYDYKSKVIDLEKALSLVKDGCNIVTGLGAAEAKCFLGALHTIADKVKNVRVTNCLSVSEYDYTKPIYADSFKIESWFYSAKQRKAHAHGNLSFIPNHLHLAASKRLWAAHPDIVVVNASMPDKHGYMSIGLSNVYEKAMIEAADLVIIEANPNVPRVFGDCDIHVSQVDYILETNYELPEIPDIEPNEKDKIIGKLVADYVNDGDCIQLGIGGIPNAFAQALMTKHDLGIHTEMLTTGMVDLIEAGVVNGSRKQRNKGKVVTAFALGNKKLYEFMDDNIGIEVRNCAEVNDPYIISQNDNQISVNTTLEVDLTGQCCSESLGSTQFSGTGGQADTAIGAQMSKNGKSFIVLYSTAMVKNHHTGEREEKSKIVCQLKAGAAVSLSRNDIDFLATEYGVVSLRGTNIKERVEKIISVAHPMFREQLRADARKVGLIF